MNPTPQGHAPGRRRRQEGKVEGGCLLGLILVGLFILCSVFGQIQSCRMRGEMEAENRNQASRQLVADIESRERRAAEQRVAENKQAAVNYGIYVAQSQPPAQLTQPYIRGKEVVLNADTGVDEATKKKETTYTLKSSDAASKEEVGTVVILRCNDVTTGEYISQDTGIIQNGYREDCEVTIIDASVPAVIYRKTIRGKNPGQHVTVRNYGQIRGEAPKVEEFLQSLPRR
jgi:hypothetical protein